MSEGRMWTWGRVHPAQAHQHQDDDLAWSSNAKSAPPTAPKLIDLFDTVKSKFLSDDNPFDDDVETSEANCVVIASAPAVESKPAMEMSPATDSIAREPAVEITKTRKAPLPVLSPVLVRPFDQHNQSCGDIVSISAGHYHTACVNNRSQVFTLGANLHGQCNLANQPYVTSMHLVRAPAEQFTAVKSVSDPTPIVPASTESSIVNSIFSSALLAPLASLFVDEAAPAAAKQPVAPPPKPVSDPIVSESNTMEQSSSASTTTESNNSQHSALEKDVLASELASGRLWTLVVSEANRLMIWGQPPAEHGDESIYNVSSATTASMLPVPRPLKGAEHLRITAVACGAAHALLLSDAGLTLSVGAGSRGQLGHGHQRGSARPGVIAALSTKTSVRVACGHAHSIVLTRNGQCFVFGANSDSQLALGDQTDRLLPVEVESFAKERIVDAAGGAFHSLFLAQSGAVYAVGSNSRGQLGTGDKVDRPFPVWLERVSCNDDGTNVVDGGELDSIETVEPKPNTARIVKVSAGALHSALLALNGDVFMFGDNRYGQLGLADTTNRDSPTKLPVSFPVKAVSCGCWHTAALEGSIEYAPELIPLGESARNVIELRERSSSKNF